VEPHQWPLAQRCPAEQSYYPDRNCGCPHDPSKNAARPSAAEAPSPKKKTGLGAGLQNNEWPQNKTLMNGIYPYGHTLNYKTVLPGETGSFAHYGHYLFPVTHRGESQGDLKGSPAPDVQRITHRLDTTQRPSNLPKGKYRPTSLVSLFWKPRTGRCSRNLGDRRHGSLLGAICMHCLCPATPWCDWHTWFVPFNVCALRASPSGLSG